MTKKISKLKLSRETVQCLDVAAQQHAADSPRDAASYPIRCITDGHFTCAC
jgi:hypothetical protein